MTDRPHHPPAIFLMGPTASGKTALAIELRKQFPLEIISVDSSLVYRGMDIGTAKPSPEELALAPHRLIDLRNPDEPYSAADFCADALEEMKQITAAGRIPLLVGGTIFYFNSLEFGLSKLPAADREIRNRIEKEIERDGLAAAHRRLSSQDPESGRRIHANDSQRIERALELIELTGQTPTELAASTETAAPLPYRLVKLALWTEDRHLLKERISHRFDQMLEQGLVAEIESLLKKQNLDPSLPAMRMVGYRQALEYLDGAISFEEMRDRAVIATGQLAKRQMTWIRSYPGVERLNCLDSELTRRAKGIIGRKLSDLCIY